METEGRLLHRNWNQYDTRQVVFKTKSMSAEALLNGYNKAYRDFYSWTNIARASMQHENWHQAIRHLAYAGGWKKFEPLWNFIIKTKGLNQMLPMLESILGKMKSSKQQQALHPFPAIA
jgi:hypothetical protein